MYTLFYSTPPTHTRTHTCASRLHMWIAMRKIYGKDIFTPLHAFEALHCLIVACALQSKGIIYNKIRLLYYYSIFVGSLSEWVMNSECFSLVLWLICSHWEQCPYEIFKCPIEIWTPKTFFNSYNMPHIIHTQTLARTHIIGMPWIYIIILFS